MRPFYRFAYNVVGLELSLHRPRIEGREHVPRGGCLIVSNHASYMDPTTVGWAVAREIYYLGRKTLFKPPVMNWFLPICNVLPIDRDGHDMSGLRRIIKMLKGGDAVLLFPEGTRSPDGALQPAEPGAGLVAIKAGVPVLPVRLFGTFECLSKKARRFQFHPIRVVIGEPYRPSVSEGRLDKNIYAQVAQEMMDRIAALK
ncbi:MAG TPA: lysophospholipid acyltransferase family protein [Candidatus Methylacidiphilales bacterium]|nr:lysophospholipid acyltransferase family protein [Candidatus Methylacidiphilales bacterium]